MAKTKTRGSDYVGRMMRSDRARSCRAISIGSASISTSFAASSSTSCCAERISDLDNLNRQFFPTQQPGHAVPHARRALVGVHGPPTVPDMRA
jgi:hypothetical protein